MNENHIENVDSGLNIKPRWTFSGDVANQFETHVRKSVPDYDEIQDFICKYAQFFISDNSLVYDIGCSTGFTLHYLKNKCSNVNFKAIRIDSISGMVEKANSEHSVEGIEFICDDALSFNYDVFSFGICCLFLQFLQKGNREFILKKLFNSLNPGGAIIVFEKVYEEYPLLQDINATLYLNFKIEKGFSPSQIISKQNSLVGVMTPNTQNENINLFKSVGFSLVSLIFKKLSFEGYLLVK